MRKIIVILLVSGSLQVQSQKLFKGVGVFGALTVSKHSYKNLDTDKKDTTFVYADYYPESHVSKEFLNWGAGIFLELSRNENVRWQTELEYCNKGAKEMGLLNIYTGDRTGTYLNNKLT